MIQVSLHHIDVCSNVKSIRRFLFLHTILTQPAHVKVNDVILIKECLSIAAIFQTGLNSARTSDKTRRYYFTSSNKR